MVFNNAESHVLRVPKPKGRHEHWINLVLAHQVKASIIRIDMLEIHGMVFSGFKELKFYGCNVQPNPWETWKPSRSGYSSQYNSNKNLNEVAEAGLVRIFLLVS